MIERSSTNSSVGCPSLSIGHITFRKQVEVAGVVVGGGGGERAISPSNVQSCVTPSIVDPIRIRQLFGVGKNRALQQ